MTTFYNAHFQPQIGTVIIMKKFWKDEADFKAELWGFAFIASTVTIALVLLAQSA